MFSECIVNVHRGAALVTRAAEDYYQVLGVGKEADKKEIKSAYRQKVGSCNAASGILADQSTIQCTHMALHLVVLR